MYTGTSGDDTPRDDERRGYYQGASIGTFRDLSKKELDQMNWEKLFPTIFERLPDDTLVIKP